MADRTRAHPAPGQRDHPSNYSVEQLRGMLVEDAVLNHATELRWMMYALIRIDQLTGNGLEATWISIVKEVESLTGRPEMPLHSGVIL